MKFNFDNENIDTFPELLDDLKKLNLNLKNFRIKIEAIQVTKNNYSKFIDVNFKEFADAYLKLIKLLNNTKFNYDYNAIFPTPCMANSNNSFLVEPNGDIRRCISAFAINEFYLNNISKMDILLINKKQLLDKNKIYNFCLEKKCKFLPICELGCHLEKYYNKDLNQCKKKFYEYFLKQLLINKIKKNETNS